MQAECRALSVRGQHGFGTKVAYNQKGIPRTGLRMRGGCSAVPFDPERFRCWTGVSSVHSENVKRFEV